MHSVNERGIGHVTSQQGGPERTPTCGDSSPEKGAKLRTDLNTEVTKPINPSTPTPQARDGLTQSTCAVIPTRIIPHYRGIGIGLASLSCC
jgi:hypothetical protein